jgi:carboxyl-terminal processing protease
MTERRDGGGALGAGATRSRWPVLTMAWLAIAMGACGGVGAAPETADPPPRLSQPEALEVFDFAWTRVHETYYDTTFGGLDWAEVRDELRPRAAAASSVQELRSTIEAMLARLGDSHFAVIPAEHADALDPAAVEGARGEPGAVGVELRVVEDEIVVSRVDPARAGSRAGVRPGWVVERIDTTSATRLLAVLDQLPDARRLAEARVAWATEARLAGRVGDTVAALFRDGAGTPREIAMESEPIAGTPVRFGNLPTMFSHLEYDQVPLADGCAGVIRFNVWMTPIVPELEAAFMALRHCDGFILDLRGNPGGVAGMVMGVSGYFMTEQKPLGVMTTRQGELRLVSMPRRVTSGGQRIEPFTGPLALVVDGQSMSTSEIFAAGLQGVGRARVFGEPSGGQALPALMVRMPNQDVLMYAFADFVGPAGTRIEGAGVTPDVPVPLTRADLLAGRDAPLEAALRWIEAQ